jgi:hypothetical protein
MSKELGLVLQPEHDVLRLVDEQTGKRLLTPSERLAKGEVEISRLVSRERAARQEAEQEAARLREEVKRLRKR